MAAASSKIAATASGLSPVDGSRGGKVGLGEVDGGVEEGEGTVVVVDGETVVVVDAVGGVDVVDGGSEVDGGTDEVVEGALVGGDVVGFTVVVVDEGAVVLLEVVEVEVDGVVVVLDGDVVDVDVVTSVVVVVVCCSFSSTLKCEISLPEGWENVTLAWGGS